jgi:hypothetical protein
MYRPDTEVQFESKACSSVNIVRSKLINNGKWKRAGDKALKADK